jgi:hypothetical protein
MSEYEDVAIRKLADDIRKKIADSAQRIYGVPFDADNIDHVIIAAYTLGEWAAYDNSAAGHKTGLA